MKTFGLVLVLATVMCGSAYAATATMDIYQKWTTISLPIVPFEPKPAGPGGVLTALNWDDYTNTLMRWNNVGTPPGWQTYSYDYDTGVDPAFGGMLLGEGYLLYSDPLNGNPKRITITGVPSGVPDSLGAKTDMWLSLPRAGFHILGVPYDQNIPIDQDTGYPMSFTDGTQLKDWIAASGGVGQWVGQVGLRYNGVRWVSAGVDYSGEEEEWKKGWGYLFETKVNNIAMIIENPDKW